MHVIYTRISKDHDGSSTSPQAQFEECQGLAASMGWDCEHVSDIDTSAWSRNVKRPGFRRVVAGIKEGVVEGLIVHHLDRLLRQSRELEELIDAIESQTRGRFPIYSVHGELDLSTADGRFTARILTSVAQKESDDKSRRLKLVLAKNAREGKPHGGRRPFGWNDDRTTLHPSESQALQGVIQDLLEGQSLVSCARRLNMRTTTLRQILVNPRIAGLRAHHGQVVSEGRWEPLVSAETFRLLTELLERSAHQNHTTALQHPLIGLMYCERCGGRMGSRRHSTGRKYRCRKDLGGCGVGIDANGAEAAIFVAAEGLLEHVVVVLDEPVADLEGELTVAEARLEQLSRDYYVEHAITELEFRAARQPLDDRVQELRRQVDRVPAQLTHTASDVFSELNDHERADVLRSFIHRIWVSPGVAGRRFDATRLSIELLRGVEVRE